MQVDPEAIDKAIEKAAAEVGFPEYYRGECPSPRAQSERAMAEVLRRRMRAVRGFADRSGAARVSSSLERRAPNPCRRQRENVRAGATAPPSGTSIIRIVGGVSSFAWNRLHTTVYLPGASPLNTTFGVRG